MREWKMTFGVWSFFFNQEIRFVLKVQAGTLEEARAAVLRHNRLSENIREEAL